MNRLLLASILALAACSSTPVADPPDDTLASLCDGYYSAVGGLTPEKHAKVDRAQAMKVEADCNGSGSYGPKPRGSQMGEVRGATAKVQALAKS
jgi:hypothetical protein